MWSTVSAVASEAKRDNATLLAAGVAFYAVLAVLPGIVLVLSVYGLFTDIAEAERQIDVLLGALPGAAARFLDEQMRLLSDASHPHLTFGFLASTLALFWTVSNATRAIVRAVKIAYNQEHQRSPLESRPRVLALTVAAVIVGIMSIALIAAIPVWFSTLDTDHVIISLGNLRWLLILGGFASMSVLLYRLVPPDRPQRMRSAFPGAIFATLVWTITSIGFSVYIASFGRYNETYAGLGAVIILMLWFWLAALTVIIGAEINAVLDARGAHASEPATSG